MSSPTEKPTAGTPPVATDAISSDHLRRNSDPVLDPANQHVHEHLHHSAHAQPKDNVVYAHDGHSTVPEQSSLHKHERPAHVRASTEFDDIEKQKLGSSDLPDYEANKAGVVAHDGETSSQTKPVSRGRAFYRRFRPVFHGILLAFFTGWWIATLVLHHDDMNWVIPFLLWLCIALRIFFFYVSSSYVSRPIAWTWQKTAVAAYDRIPARARTPLGAVVTVLAILIGAMASPEVADNNRENRAVSLFGLVVTVAVFWATSAHRKHINWRPVLGGMLAQFIIGLFVLRTKLGYDIFKWIADMAANLLTFAQDGVKFLLGQDTYADPGAVSFIVNVIPPIIFFVAIVQVLYYIGFLQWFIGKFATFIFWMLQVSGAEAVVAAATPFIGQGESALLVRPFVPHMTKAEIHQILTCGFATISGSILIVYIGMGLNPSALVSSCVMSIPASLAMSKLRYPETEETLTAGRVVIPDDDEHEHANAIHAFANGAWLGIKIGGSIIASILCILAFVALVDGLLGWWGRYINIQDLTLNLILGYLLYPVAFLLGVPRDGDLLRVSRLIAQKVITNEFVAFDQMQKIKGDLSPRSLLISTYALCGFGNIGSLGIQIGILSQLAPSRGGDVARLAVSALITGVVSTLTSAAVASLLIVSIPGM